MCGWDFYGIAGNLFTAEEIWGLCSFFRYNEVYTWNNVNNCVHNIIVGQLWIEQVCSRRFPLWVVYIHRHHTTSGEHHTMPHQHQANTTPHQHQHQQPTPTTNTDNQHQHQQHATTTPPHHITPTPHQHHTDTSNQHHVTPHQQPTPHQHHTNNQHHTNTTPHQHHTITTLKP